MNQLPPNTAAYRSPAVPNGPPMVRGQGPLESTVPNGSSGGPASSSGPARPVFVQGSPAPAYH
ncbi:hypothetical protein FVP74_03400 [Microbacterium saccharophilum]|uniref:Uncharacterized protein n=1 Tax=Microbacterium saccharophilum TaxID=1213358 RepID=A0A5C8I9U4_9MICO|nr:hypothetical protein FVP74_03400 [Microbacterium saccharophilum]